jgi:hypothetical protein
MKKIIYLLQFCGLGLVHQSFGQAPVSFPDGIIVGTPTTIIPSGSTYKLAVSGGIITEKVKVATNGSPFWADFVFDPKYNLRPLAELDKYIKLNKHLPEIPTTAEVTQNGIDLAQISALLLQKQEEMTLYMIEQDKKIKRLEKQVYKLSRKR